MRDVTSANEVLVRRFYEELWNGWDLGLASELLAPDLRFRGTLGATGAGIGAFMRYAETVWRTFPDWHNRIDELLGGGDTVVARLTWSGTHLGELLGVAATGQRVSYVGAGIFNIRDARIQEAWVVGDTQELWRALGALTAPEREAADG